mmetsp:Transcript_33307/g.40850  ORF Transcript_33307/g.40850 Transcript_33307/m.40850 type:complete len:129 (-) Transcript_33307:63-449(-)
MEFGNLMQVLMEENAKVLGYDISHNKTYWMDRLDQYPSTEFRGSVAHVCGEKVELPSNHCTVQNGFSRDGIHICMNAVGGRMFAAIGCLLDCVYGDGDDLLERRQECAASCNHQFMSLEPIKESMFSN